MDKQNRPEPDELKAAVKVINRAAKHPELRMDARATLLAAKAILSSLAFFDDPRA